MCNERFSETYDTPNGNFVKCDANFTVKNNSLYFLDVRLTNNLYGFRKAGKKVSGKHFRKTLRHFGCQSAIKNLDAVMTELNFAE